MKIIYCLAGTFNSGGMERIVISKANWLSKNGYKVFIVTTEQNGRPDFFQLENSVSRIDLDIMYSENVTSNPLKKYIVRKNKMRKHQKRMIDIVEIENPEIIISTFGNEVSFIPFLGGDSKKIAEIHFSRWYRIQENRKGVWKWIDRYLTWQDKRVLSRYDKFVALTHEDEKNWKSLENIIVIPNFIQTLSNRSAELTNNSIIAVGRLSYQKGYERLVEAWRIVSQSYPEWKLDIFGNGELKADLLKTIACAGLSNNINLHEPTSDIINEYAKRSALVLASRYEGLPMVLLEGMSVGLPLISFTCQCGPKDIIKQEYNGLLIPEGDVQGLAAAILKVIENPSLRKRLGENSFIESKNYSIDKIMPRWIELFHSL